jgi:hypothetical protein
MGGIDPSGQPPVPSAGSYIYPFNSNPKLGSGSVATAASNWAEQTIKTALAAAPISSYTQAQTTHNTNVITPINTAQSTANTASVSATSAQSTANTAVTNAATAQAGVNTNTTSIANLVAGQVTQAWVSLTLQDLATFPRILLSMPSVTNSQSVSGLSLSGSSFGSFSGTVSGSSCSGSFSGSISGTASGGSHNHTLSTTVSSQYPTKAVVDFTPIVVDRLCTPQYLKVITGDVSFWGSLFPLTNWLLGLYAYNPTSGNLNLVVNLGDQSGSISSHAQEYAFSLGSLSQVNPGTILFVAQVQNASSSQTRSIASLPQPGISQAATTTLKASSFTYSSTTLPSSVALSALTNNNSYLPWAALTTV